MLYFSHFSSYPGFCFFSTFLLFYFCFFRLFSLLCLLQLSLFYQKTQVVPVFLGFPVLLCCSFINLFLNIATFTEFHHIWCLKTLRWFKKQTMCRLSQFPKLINIILEGKDRILISQLKNIAGFN